MNMTKDTRIPELRCLYPFQICHASTKYINPKMTSHFEFLEISCQGECTVGGHGQPWWTTQRFAFMESTVRTSGWEWAGAEYMSITWWFNQSDLFGMVSLRDPFKGWKGDLQLGDNPRPRIESHGIVVFFSPPKTKVTHPAPMGSHDLHDPRRKDLSRSHGSGSDIKEFHLVPQTRTAPWRIHGTLVYLPTWIP